jgi:hypothetical protein
MAKEMNVNKVQKLRFTAFFPTHFNRVVRLVLLFSYLFSSSAHSAEPDMAYLVIKATVTNEERQPSWICLVRYQKCHHIAATEGLAAIKPGKYKLDHIDFGASKHSGKGTQSFDKSLRFKFEPGNIYLVGDIRLRKKKSKRYDVELNQDPDLVANACSASPELFENYPVTNLTGSKKLRFSCKS